MTDRLQTRRTPRTPLVLTAALAVGTGVVLIATGGTDGAAAQVPLPAPVQVSTPAPAAAVPAPAVVPAAPAAVPAAAPAATTIAPRTHATAPTHAAAPRPHLSVHLVRVSPRGDGQVRWTAHVTGAVPQQRSAEGSGAPGRLVVGPDQLLGTSVDYGNGDLGGSDAGAVVCTTGRPLVPVDMTFDETHEYAPGTYTLVFRSRACGHVATTDRLTFTVR